MLQIKISELPQKGFKDGINDTDIMIIEDTADTKKISIKDLKLIFSADEKLSALRSNLENQIDETKKQVNDFSTRFDDELSTIKGQYSSINQDIADVKKKMSTLQQSQLQIENQVDVFSDNVSKNTSNITDLFSKYAAQNKDIVTLKDTVENHAVQISSMSQTLQSNTSDIRDIGSKCLSLESRLDSVSSTLQRNIDNLNESLINYADSLYDRCIKYIDYYHHIHENPPNFDEPYSEMTNPTVSYILPVGAIFQTKDKDYDPNDHLPGSWYFCGLGTATETDTMTQVQFYTWTRVK